MSSEVARPSCHESGGSIGTLSLAPPGDAAPGRSTEAATSFIVCRMSLSSHAKYAPWAVLSLLASLSLLPPSASADETAKVKAATVDLMHSIMPREAYEAMLDQMYSQMSTALQQGGQKGFPPEKQAALKAAVKECLSYEELVAWTGEVYAKHFTTREIADLKTFHETPTGRKVARLLPTPAGEVGAKLTPLLMSRMPAAMKKHGLP